jgi:SAM-dependent methyltransferase
MSQENSVFSTTVRDETSGVSRDRVKQAYEALHARKAFQVTKGYYEWLLSLLQKTQGTREPGNQGGCWNPRILESPNPAPMLLDVGCGNGEMLRAAGAAGMALAGIDISENGIAQARAKVPDADLRVGSAEELPFPDARFDYITSRVLLIVPNRRWLFFWVNQLRQAIAPDQSQPLERVATQGEWQALIEASGLRVLQVVKDNRVFLPGAALQALVRVLVAVIPLRFAYQLVFVAEPR